MDIEFDINFTRELINQMPDAVMAISLSGEIFFWNHTAETIFGYTSTEAIGSLIYDLIIPIDKVEETRNAIEETCQKMVFTYESVRVRKDNSLIYVNVSKKLVRDGQDKRDYIIVNKKDITQLKVQRDIKMIEARFGDLLESNPDAIVIVNNFGYIVLVNSNTERMFDYKRTELVGKTIEVLLPDRFHYNHVAYKRKYFNDPKTRAMDTGLELYGRCKDKREFPVEVSLSPLKTEEGVFAISAIRNITGRKKAEAKFRGLLEFAPDAMVIVDLSGQIVLVNAQTEKLFSYKREELLGNYIEILLPKKLQENHIKYRTDYFKELKTRPMGEGRDLAGRRKDGTEFPAEISLSPLETEEGTLVMAAIRDITERKLLEEIRRKSEEEQNRKIQEANRLKSEFLANMSHELRTPLNGIIGFSEFLIDEKPGPLNDKQREYLNDILTSGMHLLQLINDILDLTKIESGKMTVFVEEFSPKAAIEEVISILTPMAEKKNTYITVSISPALNIVNLDLQKFKQILYNLLSNAIKFTNNNGLIKIDLFPSGDKHMNLKVIDNGIGIKEEDVSRLFIEFQQLDSSISRHYGGTGLGLVLVKKLVEIQKGFISVESKINEGSTFTITLPIYVQEDCQ